MTLEELEDFLEEDNWIFAKTYATDWPHHYIVKEKVNPDKFVAAVVYMRENGYDGYFYRKKIRYFDHKGFVYWTMGDTLPNTIIINRVVKSKSYEERARLGTLPEPRK